MRGSNLITPSRKDETMMSLNIPNSMKTAKDVIHQSCTTMQNDEFCMLKHCMRKDITSKTGEY